MSPHDDPLIAEIKILVSEEIKKITSTIISGVSSIEEYRKQCGKVSGLKRSIELIDDAIKTYTNDIDEDD